jgi:alkylation response protein AidB-like acyl-CoA dehydrogenase
MDLRLSNRQQSLQQTFAHFFAAECAPNVVRQMEHTLGAGSPGSTDPARSAEIWNKLMRLGITRLTIPEQLGGAGWGQSEAIIVAEQLGRALYQSPYFDTLTASDILLAADATAAHQLLLTQIARGEQSMALAIHERGSVDQREPSPAAFAIIAQGDGWLGTGQKRFVSCARQVKDLLIIAAISGAPTLFLIPRDQPTITLRRHDEIGRGELYTVQFDAVPLSKANVVGMIGSGNLLYVPALARARVRHAAYLVGLCQALFDITLQYTKKRIQFGRPIATFQAIAFRLASFAARIDGARLLTHYAAWQTDQKQGSRGLACELLALVGELALEWAAEAIQMHGAYGLTEEAEVQRYYRRAAVDALLLGTPTQLRAEAAKLMAAEHQAPT